jgi:hypothetical protein
VLARIEEIKGELVTRNNLTLDRILQQLQQDRLAAHDAEQFGAAVAASMGMAKLCGYLVDKQEFRGRLEVGVFAECRNIDEILAAMSKMLGPTELALMRPALTKLIGGPADARR